ncbi:hypothetical protein NKJ46_09630 [Mesorhizobium sp. M0166]
MVEDFTDRKVVGLLTEGHLMQRYAEELDKARRDLSGGGEPTSGYEPTLTFADRILSGCLRLISAAQHPLAIA